LFRLAILPRQATLAGVRGLAAVLAAGGVSMGGAGVYLRNVHHLPVYH